MARRRTSDHLEQVQSLLAQAAALPHSSTRIDLCEEAASVADAHNDIGLAYQAREELVEAACFGGRPDLLIVAFSWCLSTFDRNPDADISAYQLLWRMKWVVAALPKFPEIELATMHEMLDDMERRFRIYSGSIQPVVGKRRLVALLTGDFEEARKVHKQFMRMSRTFLSDCHACELDGLAGYWMDTGKNVLGVRKAEELIESGMSCAKVPDSTYADVLLPMLKIGRAKEAMAYHKKGYPRIRRSVDDMWHWGQHMAFLALTGNDARALKLFEKHLPDVESSHDPSSTLAFWRYSIVMLECVAERKEKAKLRLPAQSPMANGNGEYVLADLAKKVRERAVELTQRFDRRNRNSYHSELLDQLDDLNKKATRVPIN
jgi:hypothetical protein